MGRTGMRVKLVTPDCVLRIGLVPYWQTHFANLLSSINKKVGETLFPLANPNADLTEVEFSVLDDNGNEILQRSRSIKEVALTRPCFKVLQSAIEQIHAWAEDSRCPSEIKEFCRKFRLPDPEKDSSAYRLTGGPFSRKVHVLWGFQTIGSEAFLPTSTISKNWNDAAYRKDIRKKCQGSPLYRFFRLLLSVISGLVAVSLVVLGPIYLVRMPVYCPVHHCHVGSGVWNFWKIEEECPQRCILTGCNRHLDVNRKCHAHICKKCNRQLPVSNEANGLCDECFLGEIK